MNKSFEVAVLIGRFQPFHNAHRELLSKALVHADHCVVVLGTSFKPATPLNPFPWRLRERMIRESLQRDERGRVSFLPLRDFHDDGRWLRAVQQGVSRLLGKPAHAVSVVGAVKDSTREYLLRFPGWTPVLQDDVSGARAHAIRDRLFQGLHDGVADPVASIREWISPATAALLDEWCQTADAIELTKEWAVLQQYRTEWSRAPYPPVFVTVDVVLRCAGHVLLIRRGRPLGKGLYAVPGGFIEQRETIFQCAVRELREETGLSIDAPALQASLRAVDVFADPDRSVRGRAITHVHFFDLGDEIPLPAVRAGDDAEAVSWVRIGELQAMESSFHDDHFQMLDHFLDLSSHARS